MGLSLAQRLLGRSVGRSGGDGGGGYDMSKCCITGGGALDLFSCVSRVCVCGVLYFFFFFLAMRKDRVWTLCS